MSKQPNIRWRQSDNEALRKAVKNYNAKITRLENQKPHLTNHMPERASVKELREKIESFPKGEARKAFNREIDKLREFASRDIDTVYDVRRRKSFQWNESDNAALSKAVRRFNAKIDRLAAANPEIKNALPQRATVKQYKRIIGTRRDLNSELKSLERFMQEGADKIVDVPDSYYNLKTTQWQKDEMLRRVDKINTKRKERYDAIKDIEMSSRGQGLGYTVGQAMQDIGTGGIAKSSVEPMNAFTDKMTRTDLHYKFQGILYESQSSYWNEREEIMKNTYIRTLRENFADKDLADIISVIENMDFGDFYKTYLSDSGKWESLYPGNKDDDSTYLEDLRSTWIPNYGDDN